MRTESNQTAMFHTSWTLWKNQFLFEIFGEDGYIKINGRGGSYGVQTVTKGLRPKEFGVPTEEVWEFPGEDHSWDSEWDDFLTSLENGLTPMSSGQDVLETMRVVDSAYQSITAGHPIRVNRQ